jgi:hypothetical protein
MVLQRAMKTPLTTLLLMGQSHASASASVLVQAQKMLEQACLSPCVLPQHLPDLMSNAWTHLCTETDQKDWLLDSL